MKIICPVDLKPASMNALDFAVKQAKQQTAELLLLHAVPETTLVTKEDFTPDSVLKAASEVDQILDKLCTQIYQQDGIKARYVISADELSSAIAAMEGQYEKCMVIMGTDGANELKKYVFGSNATEVIEKVQMPVLVIPSDYEEQEIKHLVYATNYQPGDDESITQLLGMADLLGANVTILHISNKPDPEYKDIFQAYQDYVFSEFYYDFQLKIEQVNAKDTAEGLIDYMSEHNGDVLAMLTHKRGFFKEMFHDSLTRKMALIAEYPILVFHR